MITKEHTGLLDEEYITRVWKFVLLERSKKTLGFSLEQGQRDKEDN